MFNMIVCLADVTVQNEKVDLPFVCFLDGGSQQMYYFRCLSVFPECILFVFQTVTFT